jgi:hypothetical protein
MMVVLATQQEKAAFDDLFAHIIMEFLRTHIQASVVHDYRLLSSVFPWRSTANTLTITL